MAHVPNEKTCLWAVPSCQLLPVSRLSQLQFWFTWLSVCVPWTFSMHQMVSTHLPSANPLRVYRFNCTHRFLFRWDYRSKFFFPAIICISFVCGIYQIFFDSPVSSSHLLPPPVAHRCLALACPSRWRWRRTTVVDVMSWPFADTSWTGTSSRFTLSTLPATTLWVIWQAVSEHAEVLVCFTSWTGQIMAFCEWGTK